MAKEAVFIPPAVPPGEPPINIKNIIQNTVAALAAEILIVLNPTERVAID